MPTNHIFSLTDLWHNWTLLLLLLLDNVRYGFGWKPWNKVFRCKISCCDGPSSSNHGHFLSHARYGKMLCVCACALAYGGRPSSCRNTIHNTKYENLVCGPVFYYTEHNCHELKWFLWWQTYRICTKFPFKKGISKGIFGILQKTLVGPCVEVELPSWIKFQFHLCRENKRNARNGARYVAHAIATCLLKQVKRTVAALQWT